MNKNFQSGEERGKEKRQNIQPTNIYEENRSNGSE